MKSLRLALEQYRDKLSKEDYNNLIYTSSILMGIEAVIVCKDVCELSNDQTSKVLKWALDHILKGLNFKSQ